MQRVLLLSGFWPPHVGGIERYSRALAEELVSRGSVVDAVACRSGSEPTATVPGLRIFLYEGIVVGGRIPLPRVLSRGNWRLARLVRRGEYDVVIAMSHYYLANILALVAQRRVSARVWVNHASGHVPALGGRSLRFAVHIYEHLMAAVVRRLTNRYAGVSEASAAWMPHLGASGAAVLRNAVDPGGTVDEARRADRVRNVLFVGRFQPGKGALEAVEILDRARGQTGSDMALTVVGDGPDRAALEQLGRSRPWLSVMGPVSRSEVYDLMATHDVLLFPSTYPEGLPTVFLEAGLNGLPVVTFPVGGVGDIAPSGRELFVVGSAAEATTKLVELNEKPGLAASSARLLRETVLQEFTWARTAEALHELIQG